MLKPGGSENPSALSMFVALDVATSSRYEVLHQFDSIKIPVASFSPGKSRRSGSNCTVKRWRAWPTTQRLAFAAAAVAARPARATSSALTQGGGLSSTEKDGIPSPPAAMTKALEISIRGLKAGAPSSRKSASAPPAASMTASVMRSSRCAV